ncbi:helix-turn-helix domain-containing protein [Sphingosinicella sp. LHD-64]|uniref:winged helix-turn-helix transcriptional regulator n=1 Tax=Sphingosinicella sp. LHD-64 TaxID=3072139 RepID=UPI00280D7404|nr:helix-turn-helix domain-containing protein [Sphingosinicella sp. LHD-64]MDQ8757961.1 helix-turn-helix domain-containing protein [Sphingosinicella sp. LHD-64]
MVSLYSIGARDEAPTPMTDCPMTAALNAIGGKWALICLYFLDTGTRRFNELRRLMPDVSHKVLAETLRNLEQEGLIVRTVHSLAPSHVEYEISPHGESVLPLMHAVRAWGRGHLTWLRARASG